MLAGYRNKQIGGALGIGEKTVKMHRARLKEALGVETSAEVIRIGLEAALTASDPDSRRSGQ
jgi:DNA-binding CsgD family transcriptional regulator